jgi:hypothetical protein
MIRRAKTYSSALGRPLQYEKLMAQGENLYLQRSSGAYCVA